MLSPLQTSLLALCVATATQGRAEQELLAHAATQELVEPTDEGWHSITLATDEAAAQQYFDKGMRSMLYGHQEAAFLSFQRALAIDPEQPLTHLGVLLSLMGQGMIYQEYAEQIHAQLKELLPKYRATAREEDYLEIFILLLAEERREAAEKITKLSERFRADTHAKLWAILLLHDGYDALNNPQPMQELALQYAQQLYQSEPQNALACFLRALIEEAAPKPTEQAYQAAQAAAQLAPQEPSAQLLWGHYLFRQEKYLEAYEQFEKAAQIEQAWYKEQGLKMQDSPLFFKAKLYALACIQMNMEPEASQQQLLACFKHLLELEPENSNSAEPQLSPAAHLYLWEVKSLYLRHLSQQKKVSSKQLQAALKQAKVKQEHPHYQLLLFYHSCLRACIEARALFDEGNNEAAQLKLNQAQKFYEELVQASSQNIGNQLLMYLGRAIESCGISLSLCRASLYPASRENWLRHAQENRRQGGQLMPPPQVIIKAYQIPHTP